MAPMATPIVKCILFKDLLPLKLGYGLKDFYVRLKSHANEALRQSQGKHADWLAEQDKRHQPGISWR